MRRIRVGLLLGLALITSGCGYSSHYMTGSGNPHITNISPAMVTAGGSAFSLIVGGSGFGMDAVVYWGNSPRMTAYATTTQVTASITAMDIAAAGTIQVYVHSGGMNSNTATFTIQ